MYAEYLENKIKDVFDFLSLNSKEKIFKISINENSDIFTENQIKNFINTIDNYMELIEIYIVIKFVIFQKTLNEQNNLIIKLSKLFDLLINIYDSFDGNIYKIRKLSGSKNYLSILFKKMNIIYILVRKQGFFKKNIY